jgi:hopanoid biosynthesis associated protein HpnK
VSEAKRSLILNADDFGYSAQVNAAILKAHREGVLTSASLMVAESGFDEAVEMARQNPALGVGLHVVVTNDHPLLAPSGIPHIIGPNGKLLANPLRIGLRYAFSQQAQVEMMQEMEAQFARFDATGLPWSHADGHQHFHLHPTVWNLFLALCVEYGVYRVRLPYEEILPHLHDGGDRAPINLFAALAFRLLRRRALRSLREHEQKGGKPFFVCDRVYGLLQTGRMDTRYTLRLLNRLAGSTNEIYFHPGAPHARLLPESERTATVKDVELAALLDPALRARIAEQGLCLQTYPESESRMPAPADKVAT